MDDPGDWLERVKNNLQMIRSKSVTEFTKLYNFL